VSSAGQIFRISISTETGIKKENVSDAVLRKGYGIVGDAHAGSARQVSLLSYESFEKVRNGVVDVKPGDFAENITTVGLSFKDAAVGKRMLVGENSELVVTQIGKECHHGCYIQEAVGDCIMPHEGIFAEVVKGGSIKVGDSIRWWTT
jgi:MOSC domain-containing protein YiiM